MARYTQQCSAECNFAHRNYDYGKVIAANKEIFTTIYENYCDTVPKNHLELMIMSGLRLAYPGIGQTGSEDEDELFVISNEPLEMVKLWICPMTGRGSPARGHTGALT